MRARIRGAAIEYEDQGSGIPVLLVHAFPLDHHLWRRQIEALSRQARILAPDLRGFGGSDDSPAGMTLEDHAADLVALLDSQGIERAVWCGLSMGGYITLAALEAFPNRIAAILFCNTRSEADTPEGRAARLANAGRVTSDGTAPLVESMLPKMITAAHLKERPDLAGDVRAMMERQRPAGVASALRAMAARPDRSELLAKIRVPVLVITGSEDSLIPPAETEAMARRAPGARSLVIPGAAHLSNIDQPDPFNAAVSAFLTGLR